MRRAGGWVARRVDAESWGCGQHKKAGAVGSSAVLSAPTWLPACLPGADAGVCQGPAAAAIPLLLCSYTGVLKQGFHDCSLPLVLPSAVAGG